MLSDEIIADLQEKLSLARLMSEESVKVDVKTLNLLLEEVLTAKGATNWADLETALANMKNSNPVTNEK
jgi:hypothetical protein